VTSIDATTGNVQIDWAAPSANGDSIQTYTIEIFHQGTTSDWSSTASCDGSSSSVISSLSCFVPMSTLTAAPYSYAFDDLVLVRILATNNYGDGSYGFNTGNARIRRVPD
jgi:hypothetical protein